MKNEGQARRSNPNSLVLLGAQTSLLVLGSCLAACSGSGSPLAGESQPDDASLGIAVEAMQPITFEMVRSAASVNAHCIPDAKARVRIDSLGPVEVMHVDVEGLPPNTDFDLFVIQVPNTPFGLSWYQGDMETNGSGRAQQKFMGRFNIETFIVAPGVAPAPVIHNVPPFPDATVNPSTAPVHTFHLGLWFDSPAGAVNAGCSGVTTPFNGDHTAGPQALSTRNFPDLQGPLSQVQ